MRVRIRRLSVWSLGKHGCLLGMVVAALPSLLCASVGLALASLLRRWLEGWQQASIPILGGLVHVDLVHLTGLESLLHQLQLWTSLPAAALVLAALWLSALTGLVVGAIALLVGLTYNALAAFTGGLEVEAAPLPVPPEDKQDVPHS
jgi:hypothetical protein